MAAALLAVVRALLALSQSALAAPGHEQGAETTAWPSKIGNVRAFNLSGAPRFGVW